MKTRITIGLLGLMFLCTGCFKDEIPLDLNEGKNQRLVVDAWITDLDEPQSVFLTLTTAYLKQEEPEVVTDAEVILASDTEEYKLPHLSKGEYRLPVTWKAVEGVEYTLTVRYDKEVYEATSLMRPKPLVQNIRTMSYEDEIDSSGFELFFDLKDHPGEGDGYFGREFYEQDRYNMIVDEAGWISDDFIDGLLISDLSLGTVYLEGEEFVLEVHSVGKAAADYFTNLDLVRYREGLFDPPPHNIETNLSNGAVGFFVTSAVYQHRVISE